MMIFGEDKPADPFRTHFFRVGGTRRPPPILTGPQSNEASRAALPRWSWTLEGHARPDDTEWTGAEIKSCCRLASLLDVPLVQAAQNVVPVAVTAGDKIESLRRWASGRCLSADRAGVCSSAEVAGARARGVVREPGVN